MQGGRALGCRGVRGLGLAFWSGGSVPALPERRWQAPSAERRRLGPERRRLGPERHRPEPSEGHPDSSGLSVLHSVSNNSACTCSSRDTFNVFRPPCSSMHTMRGRYMLAACLLASALAFILTRQKLCGYSSSMVTMGPQQAQ